MSPGATLFVIFSLALACALTATPVVRGLARRLGFVDRPAERKLHPTPIPLLGGLAIYLAVVVSILAFGGNELSELLSILVAATAIAFAGLLDDRLQLPTPVKLAIQLVVAGGLFLAGVRVELGWLPAWTSPVLTIVWIVGITNAMNLLDNMDGLSCGVSAILAGFLTVIGAMNGQYYVASLAAAVFGACLGFLFFNSRPASVFMGDTGSLFLGLLLAVLAIKLRFVNASFVTWLVPVVLMGVPIFDTSLVVVSRLRRGLNPLTTPGRDHTSHRLVARGLSQRETVLVLYLATGACGVLAIYVTQASWVEGYLAAGLALVFGVFALWRLERSGRPPAG